MSQKIILGIYGSHRGGRILETFHTVHMFTGQQVFRSVGACVDLGRIVQMGPPQSSGCHAPM